MKRTKIVGTIGPASESKSSLKRMVQSGLNMARLNFSHGTYSNHKNLLSNIRSVSKGLNKPVAILQDLQGPRIRTGEVVKEGIKIKSGQEIILSPENSSQAKGKKNLTVVPIQYANLYKDVKKGDDILIEDGTIQLKVTSIKGKEIYCKVRAGELIKSHKGMNFPQSSISTPAITAKDKKDLDFGVKNQVDYIALSFVKDVKDIIILRKLIAAAEKRHSTVSKDFKKLKFHGKGQKTQTKIIAKIERPEAVANFEKILEAVDGIMIARGDLGLEVPIQDLPLIQKHIIQRCNQVAKPVIVATQMLDSMIRNPVPTRAEVTDVANAILDGTDAIMLSGETATGKYPAKAVKVMSDIADSVEQTEIDHFEQMEQFLKQINDTASSIGFSAQDIAEDVGAKFIVCVTASGFTARSVSRFRPEVPVIALTPFVKTKNQLQLSWGVQSYEMPFVKSIDELAIKTKKLLLAKKLVSKGDLIVIAASHPLDYCQKGNLVLVEEV